MNDPAGHKHELPPAQQAIRDKCFHPSGTFVEFPIEDVETSIPMRFDKIVWLYGDHLAVKTGERSLTYDDLNRYYAHQGRWLAVQAMERILSEIESMSNDEAQTAVAKTNNQV